MSYDDKKQLLHFLFDGETEGGKDYGIYVKDRHGKSLNQSFDLVQYGRLNALGQIIAEQEKAAREPLFDLDENDESSHKRERYKTNLERLGKQRK